MRVAFPGFAGRTRAAAGQKRADKWRQGEWLEHIDAHERVNPETARALFHWLVEGAK